MTRGTLPLRSKEASGEQSRVVSKSVPSAPRAGTNTEAQGVLSTNWYKGRPTIAATCTYSRGAPPQEDGLGGAEAAAKSARSSIEEEKK